MAPKSLKKAVMSYITLFIFSVGGAKEVSFTEEDPLHPSLETLAQALAEEPELVLCSSGQGGGASPFLACIHLPPLLSPSLHGC